MSNSEMFAVFMAMYGGKIVIVALLGVLGFTLFGG